MHLAGRDKFVAAPVRGAAGSWARHWSEIDDRACLRRGVRAAGYSGGIGHDVVSCRAQRVPLVFIGTDSDAQANVDRVRDHGWQPDGSRVLPCARHAQHQGVELAAHVGQCRSNSVMLSSTELTRCHRRACRL